MNDGAPGHGLCDAARIGRPQHDGRAARDLVRSPSRAPAGRVRRSSVRPGCAITSRPPPRPRPQSRGAARRSAAGAHRSRQEHALQHDRRSPAEPDRRPSADDPDGGRPREPGGSRRAHRGPLVGLDAGQVQLVSDPAATPGLAVVDAPDIDSVEHANRGHRRPAGRGRGPLHLRHDRVALCRPRAWNVLGRVRERGLPLVVVVNRLPPDAADRREVLDDVRRLFNEAGGATPEPESSRSSGRRRGSTWRPVAPRSTRGGRVRARPHRDAADRPRGAGRHLRPVPSPARSGARSGRGPARRRQRARGDRRRRPRRSATDNSTAASPSSRMSSGTGCSSARRPSAIGRTTSARTT